MMKFSKYLFLSLLAVTSIHSYGFNSHVFGTVTDTDGRPVQGIQISDGYTVVQTDAQGKYSFLRDTAAYYIYYTIPADRQIPIRYGIPCFFKKLGRDSVYDFRLAPRETACTQKFNIFFLADPQCQNLYHLRRFHSETVPDIRNYASRLTGPNYSITLGDIAYTAGEVNTTYILPIMKEEMEVERYGMPVFQTNGNHDHIHEGLSLDSESPIPMKRYLRMFEDIFGPTDYSWNRGQAHIVSFNDVMYTKLNVGRQYHGELTPQQLKWLKQDLSFVSHDKLLIICTHIPVYKMANKEKLLKLLQPYKHAVIFSGHLHANRTYRHSAGIIEYNLAAACGNWWYSRCNGDGTPNGYEVVSVDGNKIANMIWKSTGFDAQKQIRVYRGNSCFGGNYEKFQLPWDKKTILANVFAGGKGWKVQIYDGDRLLGDMQPMPVGDGKDYLPSTTSSKDWWAIGYNVGVVGRGHIGNSNRKNHCPRCAHMYIYKLKNAKAKIRVVATDPFGNKYEQSQVLEGDAMNNFQTIYGEDVPPTYEPSPIW